MFQIGFKIAVGLGIALICGVVDPYLSGAKIAKGLVYALIIWLINAAVVLPAPGEGFAGAHALTTTGTIAFALAHTSFFIILALLV